MKKIIGITLASCICIVTLLSSCAAGGDENTAVNRAIRSALSAASVVEGEVPELDSQEALKLVTEKLDPEEGYSAVVTEAPTLIDARSCYLVSVSLDGAVLEPAAAVDAVSGDLYSCYEGKSLSDFNELPFLAESAKTRNWAGTYVREDSGARVEIRQNDTHSFEFTLESSASGITSKLNGIVQLVPDTMAQYTGEDGMSLVFELDLEGSGLMIHVSSENTAASAGGYAGSYQLEE